MKEKKFLPHIIAILIMVVWGASYLSIKVVVDEVHPVMAAFYRFIIAAVILFIALKVKYPKAKILKEDRWKMALGGFLGVTAYFFLENYSVLYTSASNVSILIASIPVFTLVAQRMIFKERFTTNKVLGVILSFGGILLIVLSKDDVSLFSKGTMGDMMALGAALCWVMYNVVISKLKGQYNSLIITTYQIMWGTVFFLPAIFFVPITMPSTKAILNILYLAIFCSFIAYIAYIYVLGKLGATVLTTYINLQPIISIVLAFFILKEKITLVQGLGCLIIVGGVFLVNRTTNKNVEKLL